MTDNNAPGLALLAAGLCLFGALAIIAWHADAAKEMEASKKLPASTYVTGLNTSSCSK